MSPRLNKKEMRDAVKEALQEYIDAKVRAFGYLSLATVGALILGALVYLSLWANGWRHP